MDTVGLGASVMVSSGVGLGASVKLGIAVGLDGIAVGVGVISASPCSPAHAQSTKQSILTHNNSIIFLLYLDVKFFLKLIVPLSYAKQHPLF